LCREYGRSSHFVCTRTEWHVATVPVPPTGFPGGHGHKPSPSPQSTCRLDGQTPMPPPPQPCKGKQLVHCSTARTESTLFLQMLMFDNQPEPPFQHPGINFPGEAVQCDTPIIGEHTPVPLFENGDHHPVCHSTGNVPDLHATLTRRVSHDSPTMFRAFSISGLISSTPGALPLKNFLTTSAISAKVMVEAKIWLRFPPSLQTLPPLPQRMCWSGSAVLLPD